MIRLLEVSHCLKNIMPGKCLRSIYFAFIYPYLQYGIEFWGRDKYLHNMLILQKTAIRQSAFANPS